MSKDGQQAGPGSRRSDASISRRTLARGAAWSLPAVVVAAKAPLVAASACVQTVTTWVPIEPANGSTLANGTTTTARFPGLSGTQYVFTVNVDPSCPVLYELQGGQGGHVDGGGAGHLAGSIALSVGGTSQILTIVAGSGGRQGGTANPGYGGWGYGHGATVPNDSGGTRGGGGAGSAILLGAHANNQPIVVAGGGGGAAGAVSNGHGIQIPPSPLQGGEGGALAGGVASSPNNGRVESGESATVGDSANSSRIAIHGPHGGAGASGATGGAGGVVTTWNFGTGTSQPTGLGDAYTYTAAGAAGSNWPGTSPGAGVIAASYGGGNGGAPAVGGSLSVTGGIITGGTTHATNKSTTATVTAGGGGGGGYAGGGGGGTHYSGAKGSEANAAIAERTDGGGGGGGSSFVATALTGVSVTYTATQLARNAGTAPPNMLVGDGIPGFVKLTYSPGR